MKSKWIAIILFSLCVLFPPTLSAQRPPQRESLVWSPDGTQIATVLSEEVVIWDVATQSILQRIQTFRPEAHIVQLGWSPDNRIALAFTDSSIGIWNAGDGQLITWLETERGSQDYQVHVELISALAWSPDGQYLVSGAVAEGYAVWDTQDYTVHNQVYTYTAEDILFTDEETFVLAMISAAVSYHVDAASSDSDLREILFMNPFRSERPSGNGALNLLKYNTTNEIMMAATYAGDIFVWDIQQHELVHTFSIEEGFPWEKEIVTINDDLLIFIEEDRTVRRYNIFTGEPIETAITLDSHRAMGWSPLGGRIAYLTSGSSEGEIGLEMDVVFSDVEDVQRLLLACGIEDDEDIGSGIDLDEIMEQLPSDAPVSCADEIIAVVNAYHAAN